MRKLGLRRPEETQEIFQECFLYGQDETGTLMFSTRPFDYQQIPEEYRISLTAFLASTDLEISESDLSLNPESPREGENVYVNITIHNNGDADVSNFEVAFTYYLPVEGEYKIITESKTVTDTIINGSSRLVSFLWMGANVTEGDHLLAIEVDLPSDEYPKGKIVEKNENNNQPHNHQRDLAVWESFRGDVLLVHVKKQLFSFFCSLFNDYIEPFNYFFLSAFF